MMNNHSAKYSAFPLVFLPRSPAFTPCAIFVLLNQMKEKPGVFLHPVLYFILLHYWLDYYAAKNDNACGGMKSEQQPYASVHPGVI